MIPIIAFMWVNVHTVYMYTICTCVHVDCTCNSVASSVNGCGMYMYV